MISKINKYPLYLASMACIVFLLLVLRNHGLYPVVFGDEYWYSIYSRLALWKDATLPNYLYFAIFQVTNYCTDYLGCTRIINSLLFVAATPFIYLTATQVCTKKIAFFITLFALLSPINSYSAYYMPESFYYFAFWVFTWFLLQLKNSAHLISWCIAGAVLGFAALIKPHALFLLPAIILYIVYVEKITLKTFIVAGIFVTTFLSVKLLMGFILAGQSGLTLLGTTYGSIGHSATSSMAHILELLHLALISLQGHVLAMSLLFALPIAAALNVVNFSHAGENPDKKIAFYTLAILSNLLVVVALFSASVANSGGYESIDRLHMRYYNFMFPLLLMVLASQLLASTTSLKGRALMIAVIAPLFIYAVVTKLKPFIPSFVDCPEIYALIHKPVIFYGLSSLSLIAMLLWVYRPLQGAKLFIYFILPVYLATSWIPIKNALHHHRIASKYDNAGIFAKNYLSPEERAKLLVIGSSGSGIMRSLFHVDHPQATSAYIEPHSAYHFSKTPFDKTWLLVIDNNVDSSIGLFRIPMDGFTLIYQPYHYTLRNIT